MIEFTDGQQVPLAGTNNSFTRAAWLRDHPEIRFLERMGVVGGEDMVFFQTASRADQLGHGADQKDQRVEIEEGADESHPLPFDDAA